MYPTVASLAHASAHAGAHVRSHRPQTGDSPHLALGIDPFVGRNDVPDVSEVTETDANSSRGLDQSAASSTASAARPRLGSVVALSLQRQRDAERQEEQMNNGAPVGFMGRPARSNFPGADDRDRFDQLLHREDGGDDSEPAGNPPALAANRVGIGSMIFVIVSIGSHMLATSVIVGAVAGRARQGAAPSSGEPCRDRHLHRSAAAPMVNT